jgi:hypothetical protein
LDTYLVLTRQFVGKNALPSGRAFFNIYSIDIYFNPFHLTHSLAASLMIELYSAGWQFLLIMAFISSIVSLRSSPPKSVSNYYVVKIVSLVITCFTLSRQGASTRARDPACVRVAPHSRLGAKLMSIYLINKKLFKI